MCRGLRTGTDHDDNDQARNNDNSGNINQNYSGRSCADMHSRAVGGKLSLEHHPV